MSNTKEELYQDLYQDMDVLLPLEKEVEKIIDLAVPQLAEI